MLTTTTPQIMTLEEVGSDYIKLHFTKPASVTHYVHFSAISTVRVDTIGAQKPLITIRVR
ncbi:MAG TPA: hypothetical protein VKB93_10045 [Thermoanaerobaculia bacterium]|nr:hypothetical protein [Thermoanaerobaculia bacterium]